MASKPTLVLVPGILCTEAAWPGQQTALADIASVHIPELQGYSSLADMASAILASTPDSFALAGHSMGGRVALEVVDQAPSRVSHLALLDTGVSPVGDDEPERRQRFMDTVTEQGLEAFVGPWLEAILPTHLQDTAIADAVRTMIMSFSVEEFCQQMTAMLTRRDATPLLDRVHCPTLVLCGSDDTYSPPDQHQWMADRVSNAVLVVIEKCGHMSPMEQPKAVSNALRDWLLSD